MSRVSRENPQDTAFDRNRAIAVHGAKVGTVTKLLSGPPVTIEVTVDGTVGPAYYISTYTPVLGDDVIVTQLTVGQVVLGALAPVGAANVIVVADPGARTGKVGVASSLQMTATNTGGLPFTWSATGLPAGLAIGASTGAITGTPTTAGTYTITVTATDSTAASDSVTFIDTIAATGNVIVVADPGDKTGTINVAQPSLQMTATNSGGLALTYTQTGLPAGMSMTTGGLITGTPTVSGSKTVTVTATDSTTAFGKVVFIENIGLAASNSILFGYSTGGLVGETGAQAYARISASTGLGVPDICRYFSSPAVNWTSLPSFYPAGLPLIAELSWPAAEVNAGTHDAAIASAFSTYPAGRGISWLCLNHEYDVDIASLTTQAARDSALAAHKLSQIRFANSAIANKPSGTNLRTCIILASGSFIPTRYFNGLSWNDYIPQDGAGHMQAGIDDLGADSYQHGTTDANADTAGFVINGVYAAATSLNVPVIFGELGARDGGTAANISDAARAKFLTDAIAIMRAGNTKAACYFESYRGSIGPWNLCYTPDQYPLARTVWKNAIASP